MAIQARITPLEQTIVGSDGNTNHKTTRLGHRAIVAFRSADADLFFKAGDNTMLAVLTFDLNNGTDITNWKPSHKVGDWADLAYASAGTEFFIPVPIDLATDETAKKAIAALVTKMTQLGLVVHVEMLKSDVIDIAGGALYLALNGKLDADALAEWMTATAVASELKKAQVDDARNKPGTVVVSKADRIQIQNDLLEEMRKLSYTSPTLFSVSDSLMRVYDKKMSQVSNIPAFRGWCSANNLTFTANIKDELTSTVTTHEVYAPEDVSSVIVNAPELWAGNIKKLKGITVLPLMRSDGSFISKYGFDQDTEFFCVDENVSNLVAQVPDAPTQEDAQKALSWLLDEAFYNFPFVSDADKANTIGMMLSGITRPVHQRATPLYGITAPDAGTGKGLLADVCSIILQGTNAALFPLPGDEAEKGKVITSILMEEASAMVVWDNVKAGSKVKSDMLAILHTSPTWRGRLLGTNNTVALDNDRVWVATGNNIGPSEDMIRRWVQIRLDAGMENPYKRSGFKHKSLKTWVTDNRDECMVALLTVLRAWDLAGRPKPAEGTPVMGDFQPFVNAVGGALTFAGLSGFLMNADEVASSAQTGSEDETSEEFLHWLYSTLLYSRDFDVNGFNTGQIVKLLGAKSSLGIPMLSDLPIPPSVIEAAKTGERGMSNAMAVWFNSVKDRKYGPEKFRLTEADKKVGRTKGWSIEVERPVEMHELVARLAATGQH